MDQLDFKNMLLTIFSPFDLLFNMFFFFVPGFLRTFSASLLTLTLGALLAAFQKRTLNVIKALMYVFFFLYSIKDFYLNFTLDLTMLDYTTIMLSIVAPACMIIMGKRVINKKIRGHRIFSTNILWVLYVIICVIYEMLFPEQVIMVFVLAYVFFSFFFKYILTKVIRR